MDVQLELLEKVSRALAHWPDCGHEEYDPNCPFDNDEYVSVDGNFIAAEFDEQDDDGLRIIRVEVPIGRKDDTDHRKARPSA